MSPIFLVVAFQAGKPVHPKLVAPLSQASEAKPVTALEARNAFVKLAGYAMKGNGVVLGEVSIPAAERPATRSEIVGEMARMLRAAEPSLRFTPAPIRYEPPKFRVDAARMPALQRLVALGYVARVGPLAVGPDPGLTPREFGDALGFFFSRLAQTMHLPSTRWTPMLQPN